MRSLEQAAHVERTRFLDIKPAATVGLTVAGSPFPLPEHHEKKVLQVLLGAQDVFFAHKKMKTDKGGKEIQDKY